MPMDDAAPTIDELEPLADAAATVVDCHRILAKTGHNVVGEVLRGEGEFVEWSHYPADDAHDPESHCQFYYHAHAPDDRTIQEHGHFHLFVRPKGMPAGVVPAPGQALPGGENDALSHVIAISMDRYGLPLRLFTTNRWVTGETWYRAEDVVRMLDEFRIEIARPNLIVSRWITAMATLYRREIAVLLHDRDAAVEEWRRTHADGDVLEDRRLEVTSMLEIALDAHARQIAEALESAKARS